MAEWLPRVVHRCSRLVSMLMVRGMADEVVGLTKLRELLTCVRAYKRRDLHTISS
jgi:hypothetical protein